MPPKKEAPKKDMFVELMVLLFVIFFIWMVYVRANSYLEYYGFGSFASIWMRFKMFLESFIPAIKVIAIIASACSLVGIIYNLRKLSRLDHEEHAIYYPSPEALAATLPDDRNERWQNVVALSGSANPSDWRVAIIEAEVMLEDLLKSKGAVGDGVGDMLKSMDKSDFLTIDNAWEAHKVRNRIAHDGASYDLNQRDTERVISQYESVFKEFKVI